MGERERDGRLQLFEKTKKYLKEKRDGCFGYLGKERNHERDGRRLQLLGKEKKNQKEEREKGGRFWLEEWGLGVFVLLVLSRLMAQVPRFQNPNFHFVINLSISQIRGKLCRCLSLCLHISIGVKVVSYLVNNLVIN